jgi:hypothetical protein
MRLTHRGEKWSVIALTTVTPRKSLTTLRDAVCVMAGQTPDQLLPGRGQLVPGGYDLRRCADGNGHWMCAGMVGPVAFMIVTRCDSGATCPRSALLVALQTGAVAHQGPIGASCPPHPRSVGESDRSGILTAMLAALEALRLITLHRYRCHVAWADQWKLRPTPEGPYPVNRLVTAVIHHKLLSGREAVDQSGLCPDLPAISIPPSAHGDEQRRGHCGKAASCTGPRRRNFPPIRHRVNFRRCPSPVSGMHQIRAGAGLRLSAGCLFEVHPRSEAAPGWRPGQAQLALAVDPDDALPDARDVAAVQAPARPGFHHAAGLADAVHRHHSEDPPASSAARSSRTRLRRSVNGPS